MAQVLIVAQQARRGTCGRHEHIQISIIVDIRVGRTAPHHRTDQVGTGLRRGNRNKLRRAVGARVVEQLYRLRISLALDDFVDLIFQMTIGSQ